MTSLLYKARRDAIDTVVNVLCCKVKDNIRTLLDLAENGETSAVIVKGEDLKYPPLILQEAFSEFVTDNQGYLGGKYSMSGNNLVIDWSDSTEWSLLNNDVKGKYKKFCKKYGDDISNALVQMFNDKVDDDVLNKVFTTDEIIEVGTLDDLNNLLGFELTNAQFTVYCEDIDDRDNFLCPYIKADNKITIQFIYGD